MACKHYVYTYSLCTWIMYIENLVSLIVISILYGIGKNEIWSVAAKENNSKINICIYKVKK